MYPNPQDVLPLPPRPDLHHYRKRAKDLVKACRSGDPAAIRAWAVTWVHDLIELARARRRWRRVLKDTGQAAGAIPRNGVIRGAESS